MKTRVLWLCVFLILGGEVVSVASANRVTVGPGGFLIKDDQLVFVIGAYSPPKGKDLSSLTEMGFNVARIGSNPDDWETCRQTGLGVWHSFDLNFSGDGVAQKKDSIRKVVEQFKDHPNLFMWESVDEPAWTDKQPEKPRVLPQPLIQGYRFLKGLDSHPVYLNHAPRNTVETLRKYNWAADILCVDVYPVIPRNLDEMYAIIPADSPGEIPRQTDLADLSPAVVGDYVDKMKAVAFEDQPVFVVLQGFAWEALRKKEDQNPELVLYPTYEQLRFMAFQAVVHGVNGITVWGLAYNDNEKNLNDLSRVLNELNDTESFILGHRTGDKPVIRYLERGYGIDKGIESLTTETEEAVTLFTVNASVNPATVLFDSLPVAFDGVKELTVLGENRSVPVTHGRFQDDYEGLGVHIYQYRK